ncbi:hypothetical protein FNF28_01269 [Cafeteria roenbergensis]|nr:hypothetical protein FNF28_01269 [Cafeteria roenbergensis]
MARMGYVPGRGLGKLEDGPRRALGLRAVGNSRGVIVRLGDGGGTGTHDDGGGGAAGGGGGGARRPGKRSRAGAGVSFVAAAGADGAGAEAGRVDLRPAAVAAAFGTASQACLVWFRNLGSAEEADEDFVEDFVEGCAQEVPPVSARVRIEGARGGESARARVGVEVLFASPEDAATAASRLQGRVFDGAPIIAELVGSAAV